MKYDPKKFNPAGVWQSFLDWKSGDKKFAKMDGAANAAFLIFLYSFFWIWVLGATFKADFPYSFDDYLQAPILEFFGMIFYSVLMLFMTYWLVPAISLIGIPICFFVSIAAGMFGCVLLWEYIKHDDKLDLILLIGPVALGFIAYWGIPSSFNEMVEIYSRLFQRIPDFLKWVYEYKIAVAIIYFGPIIGMAWRRR